MQFDMGRVPPITFGSGRVTDIPAIIRGMNCKTVFLIADSFLAEIGVTARVAEALESAGLTCVTAADIAGEPKQAMVDALSAAAREIAAEVVIGLGGGAAMDAAKLVAAIAPSAEPVERFALCKNPLPQNGLPAIAIPTTAGTGSEVTRTSIVSTADGNKDWYWGEELMFSHAVLDPELTVSLPAHLTAWTGIDAVAHALEASTARSTNAAGLLYGQEALRILAKALPRAVANGEDIDARAKMLWGSMVAGLALHNCNTHMGHNISHALGSLARIHHGLATGLALEVTLPLLTSRPDGSANYAGAAEALGGSHSADDLPKIYADLMRASDIPRALPKVCEGVSAKSLASSMKSSANHSMSQNAACDVSDDDLDQMAGMMMDLPIVA